LPLGRPDLFRLLVARAADGDEEIGREAKTSLQSWPPDELRALASDAASDPAVLAHLLASESADTPILAAVLSNPATPLQAIASAARSLQPEGLDTLLTNQTLLIRIPSLLAEVEANPLATPLQRSRVEEIRRHFFAPSGAARGPAGVPEDKASGPPPAPERIPSVIPEPAAATGSAPAPESEAEAPFAATGLADATGPAGPAPHEGTLRRILGMSVGDKIQLAFKGTREERSILIRDSSRSVQEAVLGSPKLTDNEVEVIARMRNIGEDILRQIAANRDWIKAYSIVQGLASNPKTPLGVSMKLVSRLTTHDLKIMQRDKNVPDALRRQARKTMEGRVAKPGSSGRGGH